MLDKGRIRRFHAALNAAGLRNQKANILAGFDVESTKDLTAKQADECIGKFNVMVAEKKKEAPADIRRHRSIVLTLLNKLGIYVTNGDWGRVNAFLENPRIAGKQMYKMNIDELKALQRKLRVMVKAHDAKAQEIKFLATNN